MLIVILLSDGLTTDHPHFQYIPFNRVNQTKLQTNIRPVVIKLLLHSPPPIPSRFKFIFRSPSQQLSPVHHYTDPLPNSLDRSIISLWRGKGVQDLFPSFQAERSTMGSGSVLGPCMGKGRDREKRIDGEKGVDLQMGTTLTMIWTHSSLPLARSFHYRHSPLPHHRSCRQ